jgi:uncharacterized protein (TIGR00369 family)
MGSHFCAWPGAHSVWDSLLAPTAYSTERNVSWTLLILGGKMNKRFEAITRFIEEEVPFDKYLGIKVDELREGFARLVMPFRQEFIGDKRRPALHGGIISTLIDTCSGTAVWTHCGEDDRISTVDIRVDYLRPGPADDIIAEAFVQRTGNRVSVVHAMVYAAGDQKTVIAEGRSVYNIRHVNPDVA